MLYRWDFAEDLSQRGLYVASRERYYDGIFEACSRFKSWGECREEVPSDIIAIVIWLLTYIDETDKGFIEQRRPLDNNIVSPEPRPRAQGLSLC